MLGLIQYIQDMLSKLAQIETAEPIIFWVCLGLVVGGIACLVLPQFAVLLFCDATWAIWIYVETTAVLAVTIGTAAGYGSTLVTLIVTIAVVALLFVLEVVAGFVLSLWYEFRNYIRD